MIQKNHIPKCSLEIINDFYNISTHCKHSHLKWYKSNDMETSNDKFCGIKIVIYVQYREVTLYTFKQIQPPSTKRRAILPISPPNELMSQIKNKKGEDFSLRQLPFSCASHNVSISVHLTVLSVILELCAFSTRCHLNKDNYFVCCPTEDNDSTRGKKLLQLMTVLNS